MQKKFELTISLLKEYVLFSLGFPCFGAGMRFEPVRGDGNLPWYSKPAGSSSLLHELTAWNDVGVVNRHSFTKSAYSSRARTRELELFRDVRFQQMPPWLQSLDFAVSEFLCTLAGNRREFDARFRTHPQLGWELRPFWYSQEVEAQHRMRSSHVPPVRRHVVAFEIEANGRRKDRVGGPNRHVICGRVAREILEAIVDRLFCDLVLQV